MYRRRLRKKRFFVLLCVVVLLVLFLFLLSALGNQPEQKAVETVVLNDPNGSSSASNSAPSSDTALTQTPKPQIDRKPFDGTITARCAIVIDQAGNVLFSKNENEKAYPASTTKVLTALVALNNGNISEVFRVGDEANMPKPDSSIAGLRYGENLSLEQLLNALLIPSGNDAAYVIAANIARKGSDKKLNNKEAISTFVAMMNQQAKELGATHSHFTVPDGFSDDQNYTTASDMALIANAAMKNKTFAEIVRKRQYKLPDLKLKDKNGVEKVVSRPLNNTNDLLDPSNGSYLESCTGIKTGYTGIAGFCLVSSAAKDGESYIAVVFDSTKKAVWQDARSLLVWALGD